MMNVCTLIFTFLLLGAGSATHAAEYKKCLEQQAALRTVELNCNDFDQNHLAPLFGVAVRNCAGAIEIRSRRVEDLVELTMAIRQSLDEFKPVLEYKINERLKACGSTRSFKINAEGNGGVIN